MLTGLLEPDEGMFFFYLLCTYTCRPVPNEYFEASFSAVVGWNSHTLQYNLVIYPNSAGYVCISIGYTTSTRSINADKLC